MSCHWRAKSLAMTLVGELFGTGLAYCEQRRTLAPRQDGSDDRRSRLGGHCRIRLRDRGWVRDSSVIGVYCMNRGSSCPLSRERWAEPSE